MKIQAVAVLTVSAFVATAFLSGQAQARVCSMASDCPKGFYCEPGNVGPDGGPAGLCASLPCKSNSDCGPGLTCYLEAYGVSLLEEVVTACALVDGGTCGACVPQWDAPCITASDCGPGYTCPPDTFVGSVSCGKDQQPDASEPPYATLSVIPCSAVPQPPGLLGGGDSGFPAIPPLCDAGSTCTKVTWNSCVAQQTGSCSIDADCPSTWTCGCQPIFGGGFPNPGTPVVDAGCTMTCSPPNSDLLQQVYNGFGGGGLGGGTVGSGAPTTPTASPSDSGGDAAGSGESPGSTGSSGQHAGCQIASDREDSSWMIVAAGALAWARRRRRASLLYRVSCN
jgi:MYXO-CTERM domain-containing protein